MIEISLCYRRILRFGVKMAILQSVFMIISRHYICMAHYRTISAGAVVEHNLVEFCESSYSQLVNTAMLWDHSRLENVLAIWFHMLRKKMLAIGVCWIEAVSYSFGDCLTTKQLD